MIDLIYRLSKNIHDLLSPQKIGVVLFLLQTMPAFGQDSSCFQKAKYNFEISGEYYFPASYMRNVKSDFISVLIGKNIHSNTGAHYSINAGFFSIAAQGSTLETDLSNKEYTFLTSVKGMGPMVLGRVELVESNKFYFTGDFSTGMAFFDNKFPPQADYYDWVLKLGLGLGYHFNKHFSALLSARFMHLSNGKGFGPQNPTYEGYGYSFALVKHF
ncbi:MAG: acyloxyacyl hydrolase [Bacteroidia bacterium]